MWQTFVSWLSCGILLTASAIAAARAERADGSQSPPAAVLSIPSGGTVVPLRLVGGRPIVDVRVNGKGPYAFLLDTGGAGQARADTSLVTALKLEVIGEARGSAGTVGGQVVSMPIVRFDTLQIGEATATGVAAPSRDYNVGRSEHIDGVLALGLFRECLVTLDFEHQTLHLEQGSLPEPDGREVFAISSPRGVAELTIRVADQEVVADVDTGATAGITLPLSLAPKLPLAADPQVIGRAMTVSGPAEISAAPLKGPVTIGRYTIDSPRLEFTPVMPRGNVGIDVLAEFAVTFDLAHNRLRLSRSAAGPITLTRHR